MKCKCGVELFDEDIVDYEIEWGYILPKEMRQCESDGRGFQRKSNTYRCPKCFTVKKVKNKLQWED